MGWNGTAFEDGNSLAERTWHFSRTQDTCGWSRGETVLEERLERGQELLWVLT
jgi:hypothetical protein